jgi:cytochrome c peroxidase
MPVLLIPASFKPLRDLMMKTPAIVHRKKEINAVQLVVLLGVIVLLLTGTQSALAVVAVSQPVSLTSLQSFCEANAWDRVAFPEVPGSLKCTPVPEPYTVDSTGNKASISPSIIKDKKAAIALGKMLFWDSQVGSDGIACASCHFQAGADNRSKNQINPGLRNASGKLASDDKTAIGKVFDFMGSYPNTTHLNPLLPISGKGPNYTLKKTDFPLRQYQEPQTAVAGQALQADRNAAIVYDSDDVVSSQGVYYSIFNSLTSSGKEENCKKIFPTAGPNMPLFNVGGNSVRQVEPRNTPTIINAVFNFRNFWDGRANNVFNGLDPFGLRRFANVASSASNEIYSKDAKGKLIKTRLAIFNSSLASQAVGPALSDFEMSCGGKDFPELGKKMLSLKPLAKQKTDKTDSVLGPYATTSGTINSVNTYKLLIQSAFNNNYWDVPDSQKIDGYKLIENNFSLFWGLAVQAYEATLVSDDSRFDQAVNGRDNLTVQEQNGLNLFLNQGKCIACHLGAEFTSASVEHVENAKNAADIGKYVQRMLMGDGGMALYDDGFYNIGVRPAEEDQGVGANDAYGYPLSFTRNAKLKANNPFDYSIVDPNLSSLSPDPFKTDSTLFAANLGWIAWNPKTSWGGISGLDPVVSDERDAVDGAFKTSTLRNVELTGPYFHNGGQATLEQVIQFYNRGGDRKDLFPKDPDCGGAKFTSDLYGNTVVASDPETGLIDDSGFLSGKGQMSNIAPDMAGTKELMVSTCNPGQAIQESLNLSKADVADLVAFMKSLTDERVRWEKAPFDHPSLTIPNGHLGNEQRVSGNPAQETTMNLPAVGAAGRQAKRLSALQSFDTGLR